MRGQPRGALLGLGDRKDKRYRLPMRAGRGNRTHQPSGCGTAPVSTRHTVPPNPRESPRNEGGTLSYCAVNVAGYRPVVPANGEPRAHQGDRDATRHRMRDRSRPNRRDTVDAHTAGGIHAGPRSALSIAARPHDPGNRSHCRTGEPHRTGPGAAPNTPGDDGTARLICCRITLNGLREAPSVHSNALAPARREIR